MSELSELIGKQLYCIRKSKGLTQEQVAEKSGKEGYNRSRISKIESGKENITLETLELIMKALDVTPYELFNFAKYQNPLELESKEKMVDAYKYMLMERELDEVQYVIRTTKDLFVTIDSRGKTIKT